MTLLLLTASYATPSNELAKIHPVLGPAADEPSPILFEFGSPESSQGWVVVNDGVMEGKSEGGLSIENDYLVISGITNTDGGGSSIRSRLPKDVDLAQVDGVKIRVRGAGERTFKRHLAAVQHPEQIHGVHGPVLA